MFTAALPAPGPEDVLVEVTACALNYADLLMMNGTYQDTPSFPLTPGLEIAGRILGTGSRAHGFQPGQRVAAQIASGGLADHAVVPVNRLIPLPDDVPDHIAAGLQIAYGTSHLALVRRAGLSSGDTLIVLGAAGGVGLAAVQIGATLGTRVIAIARGADRLATAKAHGADILIDSSNTEDLRGALMKHGRAQVLYDTIGGADAVAAQRCLAPEGRHLLIGFAGGGLPTIKPNHLLVKNLDVIGVNWGHYVKHAPDLVAETMGILMAWLQEGRITPHIGATYPLDKADEALERLRSRNVSGKIIVTP